MLREKSVLYKNLFKLECFPLKCCLGLFDKIPASTFHLERNLILDLKEVFNYISNSNVTDLIKFHFIANEQT